MAFADVREYTHLTDDEVEAIGRELDEIRAEVEASRGQPDRDYILRVITLQRRLAAAGRITLFASFFPRPGCWAPRCSARPRSWRTWSWATTPCTASGTG